MAARAGVCDQGFAHSECALGVIGFIFRLHVHFTSAFVQYEYRILLS
jgi:hypothetical protein